MTILNTTFRSLRKDESGIQPNRTRIRQAKFIWILAASSFLYQPPALAQQQVSSQPHATEQDPNSQAPNDSDQEQDINANSSTEPIPAVVNLDTTPVVRRVGSAESLTESVSPLRWGSLYIGGAQFMQAYDGLNGTNGTPSESDTVSMFQTAIVFDKQVEQSRVALQYSPNIAIVNQQIYTNFTSQLVSVNANMNLSSRWTLGVGDLFSIYHAQNILLANYFSVDPLTNNTLKGQIFNNVGTSIAEDVHLSLGYLLSPQTSLTFTPGYAYADTRNNGAAVVGNQYTGEVGLAHITARRYVIGLHYSHQVAQISRNADVNYDTIGGSIAAVLTKGWSVAGTVGLVDETPTGARAHVLTTADAFQVLRTMNRSSFALAYNRTQGINQIIAAGTADRVDATYSFNWTPRLSSSVGAGYFHEAVNPKSYDGKYGIVSTSFLISPSVSFVATYTRQFQSGDPGQVLSGTTNLIWGGLRWTPPPLQ